ncbi:unnamed protein product, partial [Ectocarpus sp. 12 AP-2014]
SLLESSSRSLQSTPPGRPRWPGGAHSRWLFSLAGRLTSTKAPRAAGPLSCTPPARAAYAFVVKILLDNGSKTNLVADGGFDALSRAAMGGHLGVVKALLAAGVNFEGTSTSLTTALHLAVAHGHMEVVNELMEAGANPNLRRARDGGMALALASSVGYVGIVKLLLRAKAGTSL